MTDIEIQQKDFKEIFIEKLISIDPSLDTNDVFSKLGVVLYLASKVHKGGLNLQLKDLVDCDITKKSSDLIEIKFYTNIPYLRHASGLYNYSIVFKVDEHSKIDLKTGVKSKVRSLNFVSSSSSFAKNVVSEKADRSKEEFEKHIAKEGVDEGMAGVRVRSTKVLTGDLSFSKTVGNKV